MKDPSLGDGGWPKNKRQREALGTSRRFGHFNVVGAMGIAVQLGTLELLRRAGVDYLLATVLAVEAAVVHNFIWHERYTWRDRAGALRSEWLVRLVRFHLTNGAVSLVGNAVAMRWLVGDLRCPVIPANLIAITACCLLNFLLSDRVVFTKSSRNASGGIMPNMLAQPAKNSSEAPKQPPQRTAIQRRDRVSR